MIRIRAGLRLAVAAALAAGVLLAGTPGGDGPRAALAATPDLTLVGGASYDVQPAAAKVAIRVAITATNHLHDTATQHYYFRTAYLAVLPSTTHFRLTTTGGSPSVAVSRRTSTYTLLKLDLGANLGAGVSRALTLTFDLVDPGGAPDRAIRISPSLVSFYAWAFATPSTPGSSVSVSFPAGYSVTIGRGPLSGPTTDAKGRQTWTSGPIANPLNFVADLSADRPSDYVQATRTVAVGATDATVLVRSWPDDLAWRDRVGSLMAQALPALSTSIGLPWPIQQPLVVQEALPRSTGGYAGLFNPVTDTIEVAYLAPAGVVFHEASHAWFNGSLVADRWAAEGFASYYAQVVAGILNVKITSPQLDAEQQAAAVPLNAWGAVGSQPPGTEAYGYAASLALAQAIAARAGDAGLQRVWALAAAGTGAYQPASGPPESASGPPDWRALLDLLEDTTGKSFVDLWRTWVARPSDLPALDARAAARKAYAQAVADAAPWQLGASLRSAMRTWQFDAAERELSAAEGIVRQRAALEHEAAAAGLQLPATLRQQFEAGDLVGAATEASTELATIGEIEAAAAARPANVPVLDALGLIGVDPDADMRSADAAFAAGQLDVAAKAASTAHDAWASAAAVGRGRVISAIVLGVALVLLAGLLVSSRRRRSAAPTEGLHSRP